MAWRQHVLNPGWSLGQHGFNGRGVAWHVLGSSRQSLPGARHDSDGMWEIPGTAWRKQPYSFWLEDKLGTKLQSMVIFAPKCTSGEP